MPSLAPLYLVAVLAFSSTALAMRQKPYDICSFGCVKKIYRKYCGGATCVDGTKSEAERVALCSTTCLDALGGDVMFNCLHRKDPARLDFQAVIDTNLQIVESYCSLFITPIENEDPPTLEPEGPTPFIPEDPVTLELEGPAPIELEDPVTLEAESPLSTEPVIPAPTQPVAPVPTQPEAPAPTEPEAPTPHVVVEDNYDIDDLVEFD